MSQPQVLVVGGGPVGLTLAIDLGQRGVSTMLIDKREAPGFLPKMERCNARTMEIYRRLGIADRLRAAGLDENIPMDVFLIQTLAHPPLIHHQYPSVRAWKDQTHAENNGLHPAEPYQLISQYTLEPVLKSIAEETPNVTVRFGVELIDFVQDDEGVTARVKNLDGETSEIRSTYLVGCDGGSSTVRQVLGIEFTGDANRGEQRQALFYAPDLFERIKTGPGRHYHSPEPAGGSIVVQDDTKHFTLHARRDDPTTMEELFEHLVGMPVEYKMLYNGFWTRRLMVADRFRDRRVLLAGDSAHLVIPTGGLGMNTGVGDATGLAWKLQAMLQGWGGPRLLDAYHVERHATAERNIRASGSANEGRRMWRDKWVPWLYEDSERGAQARKELIEIADPEQRKSNDLLGIEMGYRYIDSPIIEYPEGEEGPDNETRTYTPSTFPGRRIPHLWLDDGTAIQDHMGRGFTVLNVGKRAADTRELVAGLRALGAPVDEVTIDSPQVRDLYGFDTFLIRPDLHVAWRANADDEAPAGLAARVVGAA